MKCSRKQENNTLMSELLPFPHWLASNSSSHFLLLLLLFSEEIHKNYAGKFIDDDFGKRSYACCMLWRYRKIQNIEYIEDEFANHWSENLSFKADEKWKKEEICNWFSIFFISIFSLFFLLHIFRPKPKTLRLNEKISVANNSNFSTDENSQDFSSSRSVSFFDFRRKHRKSPNRMNMAVTVDREDLSDSGIEKACDDTSSISRNDIPNSPTRPVAPTLVTTTSNMENYDGSILRNEQLRPHNQQKFSTPQQSTINIENNFECQQNNNSSSGGCSGRAHESNSITNDMNKIMRMNSHPSQFRGSLGGQSNNQFNAQHEHHTTLPFSSNTYAAFKKGNVVRGILCPSLTNSFR